MNTTSLRSVGFVALVLALMASSAPRASAATGAAPAVRIQPLPPDAEGAPVFQLEWDAAPQATYLIQTGNFGDTPGLNDQVIVWKTFEAVRPTGFTGSVTIRITPRDSFGNAARSEFFRLVLPGTQIFSVEPAVFPSGAATTVSIVGQCFESNDVVRVDGVPVAGVVYLSPNQFHGPLPTLSVGQHLVELVRGGVVQSSFTVTCADAFANPELVLQGPPNAPPASPSGLQNNPAFQDNKNYGEMPRGHGRDMIIGGGLDLDDDEDGIPDVIEGMARQLPAPISHTRVDSWAAIVEMTTGGGGVSPFSGEVQLGVADMVIPGRGLDFIWARTYNSRIGRTGASVNGWTFSYDVSLAMQSDGSVLLRPGNGRADAFYPNSTGGWSRPEYFVEIGDVDADGLPDVVTFADTGRWVFNPFDTSPTAGKLRQIITRNGSTMTLGYDRSGRLAQIVDDLVRTNTVAYNGAGQLVSVTDFSGRTVRYEYDGNGDLTACVSPPVIGTPNGNDFPDGKTNRYTYTSGFPFALNRQNHLLLSCVDALGQTTAQFTYDLSGAGSPSYLRCVAMQKWTNPPTRFSYLPQTPTPANQFATRRCVVNDPVGNVAAISTDARGRWMKLEKFTGRAVPGTTVANTASLPIPKLRLDDPASYETRWSWNNDSLCTLETLPGGGQFQRIYESDFDQSTPARKRADVRVVRELPTGGGADMDGDGTLDLTERVSFITYDSRFGSDSTAGESMGLSASRLNMASAWSRRAVASGRAYHAINTKGWDGTTKGATRLHKNSIRLGWGYSPTASGFVTSATDPRGIVTTAEYDAQGNCTKVTKPSYAYGNYAIKVDGEMSYSAHGQLTAITNAADANGYRRVDTFSYYTNGPMAGYLFDWKIDASTPDTVITTGPCEYDLRGNLTRIVGPRGHDTLYTYNGLNQLVRSQTPTNLTARCITDFTYDAKNNLVESATELRDENDAFVRTIVPKHVFDVLGRCVATVAQVSASQFVTNQFFYDATHNVVAVHSPLAVSGADPHAITQFAYDEGGLPFQTIAAPGSTIQSTTQFDYDANGNVTRVSEGLEGPPRITTMEHDGFAGFGVGVSAVAGTFTPPSPVFISQTIGHIIDKTMAMDDWDTGQDARRDRGACTFGEISITKNQDTSSAQIHFVHGDMDRPVVLGAEWGSSSSARKRHWDAATPKLFDRLAKITDPNGNVTTFNYDANDNLKVLRHFGQLKDRPGTNGNLRLAESRWKYDGLDRRVEARTAFFNPATQAPIGDGASVTTFAYAPNGQCTNITDDLGRATTFAYNRPDKIFVVSVPNGKSVMACLLDKAGNIIQVTQTDTSDLGGPPQVFTRTNVFDSLNRLVSTVDNVGNTNRYAYDSASRVVRATDPKGHVRWASYDDLSRQTLALFDLNSDSNPDVVVAGAYDANSRLTSTTDANTNTTFHTYDSRNRPVLVASPDGTAHSFVWNTISDLVREQDANGTVINSSFDLLGRCVRRDITPGAGVATTTTFEAFAYNGRSQLVAATNDVSHSELEYDSLGNCTGNHTDGWNVLSTYDSVGNRVSLTYPSGRIVTYAYDALDQVTNVSSSASAMTAPTSLAQFAYAGPGRLAQRTLANGTRMDIAWNGLVSPPNAAGDFGRGQVSRINHQMAGGGAVIDRRVTAYDRNQNKTLRAQTAPFHVGGPMTTNLFAYDALNRMTDFARSSGSTDDYVQTYVLDGNGNRQTVFSNGVPQSYVMDATIPPADFQMDQYTITPFGAQQFDENGNRARVTTLPTRGVLYQYDGHNRLVSVQSESDDAGTGIPVITPVTSYSYNALGQRISKTIYPPAPAQPVTRTFVMDNWVDPDPRWPGMSAARSNRILEERAAGVLEDIFVHVSGLQEEIRENDSVGRSAPPLVRFSPAGAATYLHADDLGNVLALTDDLGNVVERYDYADFGMPIFLASDGTPIATNVSPIGNPYLFHGKRWDSETGLYFTSSFQGGWPCRWKMSELEDSLTASANGIQRFRDDPYAEDARLCDPQTGRGFNGHNPWSLKKEKPVGANGEGKKEYVGHVTILK